MSQTMQHVKNQLSKWMREHVEVFPDYGRSVTSLTGFYKRHAGSVRHPQAQSMALAPPFAFSDAAGSRSGKSAPLNEDPRALLRTLPPAVNLAGITSSLMAPASTSFNGQTSVLEDLGVPGGALSKGGGAAMSRPWQRYIWLVLVLRAVKRMTTYTPIMYVLHSHFSLPGVHHL